MLGFRGAIEGVLGAMAFAVVAVPGSTITVSVVFLMYVVGRRWM